MNSIEELKKEFGEITRLNHIRTLLEWDQQVNLPNGAFGGRAEQSALLSKIVHERLISDKIGNLIKESEKLNNLNLIDAATLREAKRDYELEVKLPTELVEEISKTASLGFVKWVDARKKDDFSIFQPLLEKMIRLQIEVAEKLNTHPDPYSTLIDLYEPGATYDWIAKIFSKSKQALNKIIKKLDASDDKPDFSILTQKWEADKQWDFSIEVIKGLNFDLEKGRQDKSAHPFTASLSSTDTRFTTRINENFFSTCLFGSIHECGHALYEMGFMEEIHDNILADGCSMGIHESQSRMWENMVGRSKDFWKFWFSKLEKSFPSNLKGVSMDNFYRSINTVQPSLIRVEADEVTYGMHIILRFELERDIIEGNVKVNELPEVWNSKMEDLLGITPPNNADGVLQDVHWSSGSFGYFPTYFLGNLYGAQFYKKALKERPALPEEYEEGNFSNLLTFLRENIHQYGKIYQAKDLIRRVTGEDLNPDYFIEYLETKFYPIYRV
ncbi:MAG: carboxypeptidase M32 [Candidatus Lokiarchaeota archaeon]|nr:carboxypeptidase M32 [Candidatus Lokiarchaeota archaeon]